MLALFLDCSTAAFFSFFLFFIPKNGAIQLMLNYKNYNKVPSGPSSFGRKRKKNRTRLSRTNIQRVIILLWQVNMSGSQIYIFIYIYTGCGYLFEKWLRIRYSRTKTKSRKLLNQHPVYKIHAMAVSVRVIRE